MTKLAEVKTLYRNNYRDVSNTLRVIADEIENGKHGPVRHVAVVLLQENGAVENVFGAGSAEPLETAGLLNAGAAYITNMVIKKCSPES